MYAVVAPGLSCIYTSWSDVERIKALYPYPKWYKTNSEEDAINWIKRNKYGHSLESVYNYGSAFKNLHVYAKYKISTDCVYYVLDTSKVGTIRVHPSDALVSYKGNKIYIKLQNIKLSDEAIGSHMSAIHNLLTILGPYIDVNIQLDHYSLFYALTNYTRNRSRPIALVRDLIKSRVGAVSYSFTVEHYKEYKDDELP